MSGEQPPASDRALDLLRPLMRTLSRTELAQTLVYVALSLGTAFAGSLAAVLLVPLVQPGQTLPFGGGLFDTYRGVEMQAAIFAAAMGAFAVLRWQAARLGARLVGGYGMGLRCTRACSIRHYRRWPIRHPRKSRTSLPTTSR